MEKVYLACASVEDIALIDMPWSFMFRKTVLILIHIFSLFLISERLWLGHGAHYRDPLISICVQMCFSITSIWFKNEPTQNIMNHVKQSHLQMHEKCTLYVPPARLKVNWPRINYSVFKAHPTFCVLSPWFLPPLLLPWESRFLLLSKFFPSAPPQRRTSSYNNLSERERRIPSLANVTFNFL